jgi:nucleoside-diphosphate-sugar epimerase
MGKRKGIPPGMTASTPLVVTGSSGRIGRLLRMLWSAAPPAGLTPLWQVRRAEGWADELVWDILADTRTRLPEGAVILHLAGSTDRTPAALAQHPELAGAVAQAAARSGARHLLFASSGAVYAPGSQDHVEDEPPHPASDYGRAKLAAEIALAGPVPATRLRIGNVAGADALLSPRVGDVVLDPVPDRPGGPMRAYVGPQVLARVLAHLATLGQTLPEVVNLAQAPAVAMADLLVASGRPWRFGPPNPQVLPRLGLDLARLVRLMPDLPAASPAGIVADLAALQGRWP